MGGTRASRVRVVLPGGKALRVELPNWDGDTRWGTTRDGRGNRIEVLYFDGDPYADEEAT